MRILKPSIHLKDFFEKLAKASNAVLMLDYDGTLAPFKIDPKEAFPYEGVEMRLNKIIRSNTRVVIISGRAIKDLIFLLSMDPLPEIWGSHGAERLKKGNVYSQAQVGQEVYEGLAQAKMRLATYIDPSRCEFKPLSMAVHWRGLSEDKIKQISENILQDWTNLLESHRLEIHAFDGGLELRPQGINKGIAVDVILKDAGPDFAAAYLGDDATDEEAFEMLGEKGLNVLVRKDIRPTKADIQLIPPQELLKFLDQWQMARP